MKLNLVCGDNARDQDGAVGMFMPLCGLKLLEYSEYLTAIIP
jgi:hypothetical protein